MRLSCPPLRLLSLVLPLALVACSSPPAHADEPEHAFPVQKTDAQWRAQLSAQQYAVLRKADTERPFKNALWNNHEKGVYRCAGCGQVLFSSEAKFESGTGWPSFYQPAAPEAVATRADWGLLGKRTEVVCSRCGGHLGHVFEDGPRPTGLRYCMNSAAMTFEKAQ
jgi:peptide-methionine (R)-S-oxide reductase